MAQRLRWRAGDESRGSFCSFTAASIFSSKLADWLLTVFFSASRRAANFFASFARFVLRLTIEGFSIVLDPQALGSVISCGTGSGRPRAAPWLLRWSWRWW